MSEKIIELGAVDVSLDYPLFRALAKRRSLRNFSEDELSNSELGKLLWACQGVTYPMLKLKTAPSAGAIYPIELYVMLKKGVYKYIPDGHALVVHLEGDFRNELSVAALNQKAIADAPAVLILCYDNQKMEPRYKSRSFRYACMEAGHIVQNGLLAAVALNMGAVPIGAFYDDDIKNLLELEGEVLYLVAVGKLA